MVTVDSKENIWIGRDNGSLNKLDLNSIKVEYLMWDSEKEGTEAIKAICEEGDFIWTGSS